MEQLALNQTKLAVIRNKWKSNQGTIIKNKSAKQCQ
jgi:hypothetical protein